jgi:hypothetical protein
VTVTGTGFTGATAVQFGTRAAGDISCSSGNSCTAASPGGSGTVNVTVTVGGLTSAASSADQFTYTFVILAGAFTWVTPQLVDPQRIDGMLRMY